VKGAVTPCFIISELESDSSIKGTETCGILQAKTDQDFGHRNLLEHTIRGRKQVRANSLISWGLMEGLAEDRTNVPHLGDQRR
tara:strand:- start:3202 stop:3450 length:249 start_codon:yes stop_codon:yes gene_type:complete